MPYAFISPHPRLPSVRIRPRQLPVQAALATLRQDYSNTIAAHTAVAAALDSVPRHAGPAEQASKYANQQVAAAAAQSLAVIAPPPSPAVEMQLRATQTDSGGGAVITPGVGRMLRVAARACALGVRKGRATAEVAASAAIGVVVGKAEKDVADALEVAEEEANWREKADARTAVAEALAAAARRKEQQRQAGV